MGEIRLTSITAYYFNSIPGSVLSVMAPGIKRPDTATCITTSNPLHPGSGNDRDQGPSSIGRRRPWSRQYSNEEPLGDIISQAIGCLVVVSLVRVLILIVKYSW